MKELRHTSWGRYPAHTQTLHPCHWRHDIPRHIRTLADEHQTLLAYGNGRSYGDSCMAASGQALSMRGLNRLLAADWDTGILIAEAGITFQEILAICLPKGWFLPVVPGTHYLTLGGAVANDVHGKNHHTHGTFGVHVRRFSLLRSDAPSALLCSPHENPDYFAATIGGLGLTGVIEWVEVQLMPVTSGLIEYEEIPFASLEEFDALSLASAHSHHYIAAWADFSGQPCTAMRGILMRGNHAKEGPLSVRGRRTLSIPFTPPVTLINRWTSRLFNTLYYRAHTRRAKTLTPYEPFFFPLDSVRHWNRLYGPRGFDQYQCVLPDPSAVDALKALLAALGKWGSSSLTVLKRCGNLPSPGWLSFPMAGISLALDFAHTDALHTTLFPKLDAIVTEAGGRLYPAKDAHMNGSDFRLWYPAWEKLQSVRDPALCSHFWKRVMS